ncbi:MAG: sigma-70 family RNA polymerase sigma factor [Puniceicoccaceae bacterium]|nr:MAG: sigma-70 family RNA polymerase sigma factor [Puniceicoccaceae bacterium]
MNDGRVLEDGERVISPDRWVDCYGDYLYQYALARVRERAVAEDLVQDTFLAALKSRDRFRGQSSERTWLVGILRHKLFDYLRRKAREVLQEMDLHQDEGSRRMHSSGFSKGCWIKEEVPNDWVSPADSLCEKEFWMVLDECCSKMPRAFARVFLLREMDGMESRDICETLKISQSNLWVMLHRARLALQRCLQSNWFTARAREKKSHS